MDPNDRKYMNLIPLTNKSLSPNPLALNHKPDVMVIV